MFIMERYKKIFEAEPKSKLINDKVIEDFKKTIKSLRPVIINKLKPKGLQRYDVVSTFSKDTDNGIVFKFNVLIYPNKKIHTANDVIGFKLQNKLDDLWHIRIFGIGVFKNVDFNKTFEKYDSISIRNEFLNYLKTIK